MLARSLFTFMFVVCTVSSAVAEDTQLSLEDILNLKVVTASKKAESQFESASSISAISREEIKNAGVTTIEEALKLLPGMIVREQTNGNSTVDVRGVDGVPYGNVWPATSNSITLVMIDNRVVYSYFQGGTFWEALPVGLDDIEKIEVVRGPASALYGPNAVTGVINIITRRPTQDGFSTWGTAVGGVKSMMRGNASVSYAKKDNWNVTASVNYDHRKRFTTSYFDYHQQTYAASAAAVSNVRDTSSGTVTGYTGNVFEGYPVADQDLARKTLGTNLFADYKFSDSASLAVETGYQNSKIQNLYMENTIIPMTRRDNSSHYLDLKGKFSNLSTHLAYMGGETVFPGSTSNANLTTAPSGCSLSNGTYMCTPGVAYDFENPAIENYRFDPKYKQLDSEIEYDLQLGSLQLRPGLYGRYAEYDSTYLRGIGESGTVKRINSIAASVRAEFKPIDSLKLIAAWRTEKFNHPRKPYHAWQASAVYQLGDSQVFRAGYARANKSPAMSELFLNIGFNPIAYIGTGDDAYNYFCTLPAVLAQLSGFGITTTAQCIANRATVQGAVASLNTTGKAVYVTVPTINVRGNPELELVKSDTYEIGHRIRLGRSFMIDTDGFYNVVSNFSGLSLTGSTNSTSGARQMGVTTGLTHVASADFVTKLFGTIQNSELRDLNGNRTGANLQTPLMYGGLVVNYKPMPKLNLNFSPTYVTAQAFQTYANKSFTGTTTDQPKFVVPAKIVLNARVGYDFIPGFTGFIAAKNMLATKSQEFGFADTTGGTYMAGVNAEF